MHNILCQNPRIKIGDKFNKLTAIGPEFRIRKLFNGQRKKDGIAYAAVYKCDCGNTTCQIRFDVLSGKVKSCGCHRIAIGVEHGKMRRRHGDTGKPLHNLWHLIKIRCLDPGQENYKDYGGRGITVCQEWRDSYEAFRDWALANGYQTGLQIDRRDNNGNYEPDNCHFVTCKENNRNRRNTPFVTAWGETKPLSAWAEDARCTVSYQTLWQRITARQVNRWPTIETAISTPPLPRGICRVNFII